MLLIKLMRQRTVQSSFNKNNPWYDNANNKRMKPHSQWDSHIPPDEKREEDKTKYSLKLKLHIHFLAAPSCILARGHRWDNPVPELPEVLLLSWSVMLPLHVQAVLTNLNVNLYIQPASNGMSAYPGICHKSLVMWALLWEIGKKKLNYLKLFLKKLYKC